MKTTFFILALLSFVCISLAQTTARTIPSYDIKTMEERTFNTSKFDNKGKPMIIVFWETFCRPCLNYFDAINESIDD